ncbi:MAG TPA: universal stress protein [Nonomuraea sp.]|nr:universal stress protein [Nonomuraea sp.]
MDRAIVVGIDGSPTAWAALEWAAEDATRRNVPLRIVHVREPWAAEHPLRASTDRETLTERDRRLLADAAERARALAPEARITTALVIGAVVERLRTEAETADTLVVGSRGLGGFAGLVLGSVGRGLAGHTRSSLVVIGTGPRERHDEVVVGYDGSPDADLAMEYAVRQAAARGARLRALYGSRQPLVGAHPVGYGPVPVDDTAEIVRRLALWREKHPEAGIVESIVHANPVPALAGASRTADLVVVGTRGRGGFTAAVLGSVSTGVLHRSRCPVALIGH